MCMYMAINNITFGAKISSIPSIKNVSGKQNLLKDVKLSGYNAFIGGDVYTPSGKIVKQDLLFKDNLLIATDEFDEEQIRNKFGYFVDALKYGTPPHGGLALGLDRLVMLITNNENFDFFAIFITDISESKETENSVTEYASVFDNNAGRVSYIQNYYYDDYGEKQDSPGRTFFLQHEGFS